MKKKISTQAACAKMIRSELKEKFPDVKFSVRSETFAGGNSVDIEWTEAVTTTDVNEVISKFRDGYFDGNSDCYEYYRNNDDIPRVKYIMLQRNISQECKNSVADFINATRPGLLDLDAINRDEHVRKIISNIDFRRTLTEAKI
jgi:hypothetical protein